MYKNPAFARLSQGGKYRLSFNNEVLKLYRGVPEDVKAVNSQIAIRLIVDGNNHLPKNMKRLMFYLCSSLGRKINIQA